MRVGINGNFWNQPRTGSGQYVRELLAALKRCAPQNEYRLVVPEEDGPTGSLPAKPPVRFLGDGIGKTWFEQITFPRACARDEIDIAHVPYFAAPWFGCERTVITIHDLIPIILPLYRGSARVQLYTRLVSEAARRAKAIIADSECSKRDIVERLGIPRERVHVIYLAADGRYRPIQDTNAVRTKYGLPQRFALYLGGHDQRKNVGVLIRALARLPDLYRSGYRLVLAGHLQDVDTPFFPDPRRIARESDLAPDAVQFIGEVAEEDKPALYSSAEVFCFPSLYEGFGLPALEAMACGTPVVCSSASSLPEIAGDTGLVADPNDIDQWAESLRTLASDPARRAEMSSRGIQQASQFTWERTARETLQVYEQVVAA